MTRRPSPSQLALDVAAGAEPLWFVPFDRHGRALPPIDVAECEAHGGGWHEATCWATVAIQAADELPLTATDQEILDATTRARAVFLALLGRPFDLCGPDDQPTP